LAEPLSSRQLRGQDLSLALSLPDRVLDHRHPGEELLLHILSQREHGGHETFFQRLEDLPLHLGCYVVIDTAHALHLVTEPSATGDLRDSILGKQGRVGVPAFMKPEARQNRWQMSG